MKWNNPLILAIDPNFRPGTSGPRTTAQGQFFRPWWIRVHRQQGKMDGGVEGHVQRGPWSCKTGFSRSLTMNALRSALVVVEAIWHQTWTPGLNVHVFEDVETWPNVPSTLRLSSNATDAQKHLQFIYTSVPCVAHPRFYHQQKNHPKS